MTGTEHSDLRRLIAEKGQRLIDEWWQQSGLAAAEKERELRDKQATRAARWAASKPQDLPMGVRAKLRAADRRKKLETEAEAAGQEPVAVELDDAI